MFKGCDKGIEMEEIMALKMKSSQSLLFSFTVSGRQKGRHFTICQNHISPFPD